MSSDQQSKLAAQTSLNAIEEQRQQLRHVVNDAAAGLKSTKEQVHHLAMTAALSEEHKLEQAEADRDAAAQTLRQAEDALAELEREHPSNLDHWK